MSSNNPRKRSNGPSVIIEIGNDWLKMMQAESARGGLSVTRLYLQKFSSSGGAGLPQSISQAIKKFKFSRIPMIACLPRQVVNVRMLELPSSDPNEIADMVDLQVGKQTPYSKDEIVSDYKILGSEREGYSKVMLVIVQRGVLRQRFSVLEEAGVDVQRMSVSSEGLLNWCRQSLGGADKVTAVLDVDSFYSDFAVMTKGSMVFTRSILVGANQLIEDYENWKDKLAREVKQSIEMCQSESHGMAPVRLVISGAGANIPDLNEYLGGQLKLSSNIKDSVGTVTKVPAEPSLSDPKYQAVSLTALIGTAMAPENMELNLVPDSILLRRSLIQKAKTLTAFGILVVTFLIVTSFYGTLKFYFKRDTLQKIEKEIKDNEPTVRNVKKMLEIIMVDRDRKDVRFTMVNLISEIHKLVPASITLDLIGLDLEKEKGQVTINGEGGSVEDVQTFVNSLERALLFKDVKDTTKKGEGGAVFKFQIECALEK
ncbi:MAG: pilus assembly protein PilM [Kiritimatiellae bacterium]|nr:pilus assembly protein PilM [Kiritimatiellia bacterium]MDD5521940.1 pilus assembly protein PilM [Kiritimatiellia bacterium]